MARLIFTQHLRRFVDAPEIECRAASLAEALEQAFAAHPRLRGYVLDDQSHLRTHVCVFIDGRRLRERHRLDEPLSPDSTVHVLQALSGG